jgi:transcriptional regulator with XRE-family HTH domain
MHGSLATRLRVLRAERGLTVRQVAELSGVAKETVSQIERGERHPYDRTLAKLARAYGVPVEELLQEAESPKASAPSAGRPSESGSGEASEAGERPKTVAEVAEEVARDSAERAGQLTEDVPRRMQEIVERVASGAVGQGVSSSAGAQEPTASVLLAYFLAVGMLTEDDLQEAREALRRRHVTHE